MHHRYGFELIHNSSDMKVFKTSCDCTHEDHDMTVELEYDKHAKNLSLTHYVKMNPTGQLKLYTTIIQRIKLCWNILMGKEIQYESSFVFRGRNHIENYCDMIYMLGKDVEKESTDYEKCRKELNKLKNKNIT